MGQPWQERVCVCLYMLESDATGVQFVYIGINSVRFSHRSTWTSSLETLRFFCHSFRNLKVDVNRDGDSDVYLLNLWWPPFIYCEYKYHRCQCKWQWQWQWCWCCDDDVGVSSNTEMYWSNLQNISFQPNSSMLWIQFAILCWRTCEIQCVPCWVWCLDWTVQHTSTWLRAQFLKTDSNKIYLLNWFAAYKARSVYQQLPFRLYIHALFSDFVLTAHTRQRTHTHTHSLRLVVKW